MALTPDQTCEALQLDAWALARLVELGELEASDDGRFKTQAVEALAIARTARRAEALADIAALDAPHLGLVP